MIEEDEFDSSAEDDNSQDGGEAEEDGEEEVMSQVEHENTVLPGRRRSSKTIRRPCRILSLHCQLMLISVVAP